MLNKGRNSIKSDNKMRLEIGDFNRFRMRTRRRIHGIKNHRIWIKIRGEISEQSLEKNLDHEERENLN